MLTNLPNDLTVDLMSLWISSVGLIYLDCAFCNKELRHIVMTEVYCSSAFVLKVSFRFSRSFKTQQNWLVARQIKIKELFLDLCLNSELFCKNDFSKLNLSEITIISIVMKSDILSDEDPFDYNDCECLKQSALQLINKCRKINQLRFLNINFSSQQLMQIDHIILSQLKSITFNFPSPFARVVNFDSMILLNNCNNLQDINFEFEKSNSQTDKNLSELVVQNCANLKCITLINISIIDQCLLSAFIKCHNLQKLVLQSDHKSFPGLMLHTLLKQLKTLETFVFVSTDFNLCYNNTSRNNKMRRRILFKCDSSGRVKYLYHESIKQFEMSKQSIDVAKHLQFVSCSNFDILRSFLECGDLNNDLLEIRGCNFYSVSVNELFGFVKPLVGETKIVIHE